MSSGHLEDVTLEKPRRRPGRRSNLVRRQTFRTARSVACRPGSSTRTPPGSLARLVLSCPAVVARHAGVVGEAATSLPGARVTGLRVLPARVEVHVVVRWPVPADEVAAQVWAVTGQVVGGRWVDVVIGDVLLPETDQIR